MYIIDNVLLPTEIGTDAVTTLINESAVVASEGGVEHPRAKQDIADEEITVKFGWDDVSIMYALYQCQGTARFFMMDHVLDGENEFTDEILDWVAGGGSTTAQLRKSYSTLDYFNADPIRTVYRTIIRPVADDTSTPLTVTLNGSPDAGWTLGDDGVITKASELTPGDVLRASGKFFKPVRFKDRLDIAQYTADVNLIQQVTLISKLPPQSEDVSVT